MDSSSKSMNYEDTSVSSSTDINENNLDCVVIPEICSQKRKDYTGKPSKNVDDYVSKLSSEEILQFHIPNYEDNPDPFRNCELKIALGTKNTLDLMHLQKNTKITDHNNDTPDISIGSSNTIIKKKAGGSSIRSPAWKWFEEAYIDNIRYGRHLDIEHGYTKNSVQQQTTITKAFETSLSKLHNTTEQAIRDKAITEVIVVQNLSLFFTEEKMFKRFAKIVDSR
ncbi:26839_t:CDS:2 [Dentiscutata erythropus]|uniref:26839_t:CDS:1 n=1 Tax=Dentiscutata erythropus TaxID=1348616 RepID=A0A9N9P184_9GLOM|nr:26839_t:CDS:2 [Dentiscutata erythropus]